MDSFSESSSVYSDDDEFFSNGTVHRSEIEEDAEARRRHAAFLARVDTSELERYG